MVRFVRYASVLYVLTVFTGGYLAVATLKGIWHQAGQFNRLAAYGENAAQNLAGLEAVEPAAGAQN